MRIVMWWSFFTAATGWAWNYASLLVTRFMFGAGEAGCFPNLTKVFTIWLPEKERVRAQGIMWLSARWGGAFTPPLVARGDGLAFARQHTRARLAALLRDLRLPRRGLGGGLLPLVPRQSRSTSRK